MNIFWDIKKSALSDLERAYESSIQCLKWFFVQWFCQNREHKIFHGVKHAGSGTWPSFKIFMPNIWKCDIIKGFWTTKSHLAWFSCNLKNKFCNFWLLSDLWPWKIGQGHWYSRKMITSSLGIMTWNTRWIWRKKVSEK